MEDGNDGIGGKLRKTTHDAVEETKICLRYVSEWYVEVFR